MAGVIPAKVCLGKAQFKPRSAANFRGILGTSSLDFDCLPGRGFDRKIFMRSSFYLSLLIVAAAAFFVTSCQEDIRYSGQTQYLGGAYGNQPTSNAPVDNVSYWDGDHIGGKPTIKISIKEQRAYFYKNGMLVGISQLSTGREGKNTPIGHFSVINKDKTHASSMYGDFVDKSDQVVKPNVAVSDPKPPGHAFQRRAHALLHANRSRVRASRRISARLSRFSRLHSNAGVHGREFFQIGLGRNAGHNHELNLARTQVRSVEQFIARYSELGMHRPCDESPIHL